MLEHELRFPGIDKSDARMAIGEGPQTLNLRDPGWFLDRLDIEKSCARFVETTRDDLSRQAFLDPRWSRERLPAAEIPGATLDAPPLPRPRLNFIWHTSFCCSTLIAAMLDGPGVNLSLKEPRALVDLADLKRRQGALKRPGLARSVFGLYGRRFGDNEQILIKPSNFANTLMAEAAQMTEGRMLMLHSSCRSFLISIIKGGEPRRKYVRELFYALAADGHPEAQWPMATLLRLPDLEMAALVWHMQMAAMRRALADLGQRAASMDGDRFLERPQASLEALDSFFGLGLGGPKIEAMASGPMLSRHAKTGGIGGMEVRNTEAAGIEMQMAADLERVTSWAADATDAPSQELPKRLILAN